MGHASHEAMREVLDRLPASNHERYNAEMADRLHEKGVKKTRPKRNKKRTKKEPDTVMMDFGNGPVIGDEE